MALQTVDVTLTNSREKSIVVTKLEEALMWANKSIALEECYYD